MPEPNDPETHAIHATLPIPVPEGGIGRVLIYKTYKDARTYMMHGDDIVWVRSLAGYRLGVISAAGLRIHLLQRGRAADHHRRRPPEARLRQSQRPEQSGDDPRAPDHRQFPPLAYTDMFFDDIKTLYDLDAPETHAIKVEQTYSDYRKGEKAKLDSLHICRCRI